MLKQFINLKLSQKLSPQQIQLMKLVQLPTQAFEQRLIEEMNENPALEMGLDEDEYQKDEFENEYDDYEEMDSDHIETDDINIDEYLSNDEIPDYKTQSNNYADDDDDRESPLSEAISFHQDLINQLNTFILSDAEREIAEFLVGSIDDFGYIRRNISDIVDDLAFTQAIYTTEADVEKLLHVIHQLEPSGVGAKDLQECLLLQLKHKTPTEYIELAIRILEEQFDAFTKKHFDKLIQKYNITNEQLKKVIHEIERLNPKPGSAFSSSKVTENILPDFTIRINDEKLELSLNGRNAPSLHVSKDYQEMMQTYKSSKDKSNNQKDAVQFIKQKLDAAKWFIDAIKQRQETLFVTMNAIMHFQYEYFIEGDDAKIKPMILKDIADVVGLDVSTVSRVASSKYVETPYGTKLIKEFFSEGITNDDGQEVSTFEIKDELKKIIETENKEKPLTDDQIVEILNQKGFPLARRTITKYRELLDIPVARMRKQMK